MMLCKTDRLMFKCHFKALSVLVFHLLLPHFSRGVARLTGPSQPVIATLGDDIILPCNLDPAVDASGFTLEWTRPDLDPRFVHVWRDGVELVGKKHKSFEGRTSLFIDELKKGNISLKLSKVKVSDKGRYRCFIPGAETQLFSELVVASGTVSSPVIRLAGIDRDKGGVVLQCESKGWYPEPDVFWLDGEGNLLSAGPTETIRGPDDLYTVSSRVTVEKRHSNNFTCSVKQNNINQTRETHIIVPDDFMFLSNSAVPTITGLAVSFAVCIVFVFVVVSFVWRKNIIKKNRNSMVKTERGEHKTPPGSTNNEMQPLTAEGTGGNTSKINEAVSENHRGKEDKQNTFKREEDLETLKEKPEIENKELKNIEQKWTETYNELLKTREQLKNTSAELRSLEKELEKSKIKVVGLQGSQKPSQEDEDTNPCQGSIKGRIFVEQVDPDSKHVRLKNMTNEDQPMGCWELQIQVDDKQPIIYTFLPSFTLKAGETATIWPSNSGVEHKPPTNLVLWKSWGPADKLLVTLFCYSGEEMAKTKVNKSCSRIDHA